MDMTQRQLKSFERIERDGNGNIVIIERYQFGRNENGKAFETLVEREEWAIIDGLNQRIN